MRRAALIVTLLAALLALAGCGGDETESTDPGQAQRIQITFDGDSVTPTGKRVEVGAGDPVELVIKADKPGELHVHSTPEQEIAYGSGTTTEQLTIDQPGVVDVESHHLDVVVLQLEVG